MEALNAQLDRKPTIEQVPPEIEAKAKQLYEDTSVGIFGVRWKWEDAKENTRTTWCLRAFIESWPPAPVQHMGGSKHE
jgi:hypothetical protein